MGETNFDSVKIGDRSLDNAAIVKGVIDCSANPNYPKAEAGDIYKVSVAGKIGGASGQVVEAGDALLCMTDSAAGNEATVGANWIILQKNLLANSLVGVGSGYKIARGQATTASASDTVVTGLATVVSAVACLEDAPVIGCDRAQAVIGNQSGAPAAGSILIKTFAPTSNSDPTPIAATTFTKKVNWIAVGT